MKYTMSWISKNITKGVSSLTGQISNLTKDILTEGTEETSGGRFRMYFLCLEYYYVFNITHRSCTELKWHLPQHSARRQSQYFVVC